MRLRTVSCQEPGWRRIRHGRGFRYVDAQGEALSEADVDRIRGLVIPPAWTEVWICPHPRGHLQAVGTDDAGRRQYLYHPHWREQRDLEKFERVHQLARTLPGLRRKLRRQLLAPSGDDEVERRRILAVGVRLIDLGCFRPGSDESADEFGSRGLTTLERRHLRREKDRLVFRFAGKAGIEHEVTIDDPAVMAALEAARRRPAGARLLASKVGSRWQPVTADELNGYIRALTGLDMTAKDFRTWHATITAAVVLAQPPLPTSRTGRAKRVREAVAEAAELLGNTPTVARSSYVDPRVIDLFDSGTVLDPVPGGPDALDRAVARLIEEHA
ncbi:MULTISPECIES: DNA topoisomerase IB [unclassified Nocardioides]|uniref:DNA topoisomerase IB n=1 Tax=unclassified Nocardioides TaxID=2615069 RepID=UPI0006F6A5AC|nr:MULTISPECIES: DNA topoisomerase IB [unclassified Nocardioides]KRA30853.1 DNA topoisomerase [Nocardioides sp. Root614]KRA87473.1 DNA topoisomerase [Nocardioides sp. Root682]